jgi:hypothetical protein
MTDISQNSIGFLIAQEQSLVYHSVFYSSMLAKYLKGDKKFPSTGNLRREFFFSSYAYFLINGR